MQPIHPRKGQSLSYATVCFLKSFAVIFVQKWGAIGPHIEAKNNTFSTIAEKKSGYDVTIPVPEVAQIVFRTVFYLHIQFGAELYACWLCRPFLSRISERKLCMILVRKNEKELDFIKRKTGHKTFDKKKRKKQTTPTLASTG